MKKFVALLMALVLVASCACVTLAEEPTTITWYGVGGISDHQARINQAASAYLQSKGINANLEIVGLSWADFAKTYQVMIAAREEFDLLNCDGASILQYGLNGGLLEVTDEMLDNNMPHVKEVAGSTLLDVLHYDGKLFNIPSMHEWAQYYGFTYYSLDVTEALGIDLSVVKSMDDLDPIFEQVHKAYPDMVVVDLLSGGETPMLTAGIDFANHSDDTCIGIDTHQENGTFFAYYENPEVKKVLDKCYEWNQKGYINDDPTVDVNSLLAQGKIFCVLGRFKPGTGAQATTSNGRYSDMAWDPEAAPTMSMKDAPSGWGTGISSTSSNPELAMQVLDLAYSDPDFLNLIVFGEEGEDYTINDKGFVEFKDGGYANQVFSQNTWQFGNQALNLVPQSYADMGLEDIWNIQKEFNSSAVAVESAGFYFDTTNVDIEMAAVANVKDEYAAMLWKGNVDDVEATLADFNKKLYDNGLQTIIDEANRQYAEFLANK